MIIFCSFKKTKKHIFTRNRNLLWGSLHFTSPIIFIVPTPTYKILTTWVRVYSIGYLQPIHTKTMYNCSTFSNMPKKKIRFPDKFILIQTPNGI